MRRSIACLVLVVAAAACAGDDDDGPTTTTTEGSTTSSTSATSTSPSTTTTTAFEGSTTPTSQPGDGPIAHLVDLRVSEDRVAFELDEAIPGFDVRYVDEAIAAGSGHRVDVEGEALLEVRMAPASGVDLSGREVRETYDGPDRVPGRGAITEVVRTGDFEANLTWVIGLDRQRPFRVVPLESPPRLAVLIGPSGRP